MKKGKLLTSVAAAALSFVMLAGCGGSGVKMEAKLEPGEGSKVTKEPLDLTIFLHRGALGAFDYDKMTIFQEAFKQTNVKLSGTASSSSTESGQEFNIMLTSATLPDIITSSKNNINKSAVDGALIPLEDLIDQYAPNIKKVFDEHPEYVSGSVASDGKLYYIPSLYEGKPSSGFYIRQDWLDKLGLQTPTTLEEYYNVLKAFRENDPNGNGKKDEIPYFFRDKGVDALIQLWGASNTWGVEADGKTVVHGKTEESYKTAMKELAKWYKEGLIDQEIYSRGSQSREQLLGNNLGGATHDWFSSTGSFNKYAAQIPGFKWVAIAPPADINGQVKELFSRQELRAMGWGISKDNQYPVETIKFFDWWFSPEGRRAYAYGVEGTDYTLVNGEPVYTQELLNSPNGVPMYMRDHGQLEFGAPMDINAEIAAMTDYAKAGFMMYNDNDYCLDQFPALSYTAEEERIVKDKGTAVLTLMAERQQEWLMGTKDIDSTWDQYVADLKSMGYDEYQKAQQSAYDRYIDAMKKAK